MIIDKNSTILLCKKIWKNTYITELVFYVTFQLLPFSVDVLQSYSIVYSDKTSSYEKLSSTDRSVRIRKIPSESKLENTLKRNIRKPQIFATEIFKVIEDLATTNFNKIFSKQSGKKKIIWDLLDSGSEIWRQPQGLYFSWH